jgi:hypothetical protein
MRLVGLVRPVVVFVAAKEDSHRLYKFHALGTYRGMQQFAAGFV